MTRIIRTHSKVSALALAASLLFVLAGCQSTPEEEPEEVVAPSEFDDASSDTSSAAAPPPVAVDVDIRSDAVSGLRGGSVALKETGTKVVIAGHTDNRGSEEYNLALGERRAASVRRYLSNLGVDMNQMTIVSYGEVRPQVQGNNETAWAKNRRAEFKAVD